MGAQQSDAALMTEFVEDPIQNWNMLASAIGRGRRVKKDAPHVVHRIKPNFLGMTKVAQPLNRPIPRWFREMNFEDFRVTLWLK